ncbi:DNA alkylation repair protein [Bdellovibrio sp. HCB-162]|uniref:DNA alkylation repair protein n=1 Tax=Bdellovibrio sp. HCB-162 TaxID=3394234 RepID=UPI0039BC45B0
MVKEIQKDIRKSADATRAKNLKRFFKTGPGEYGEGDVFIGLTVPQSRAFAKKYFATPLKDLETLLKSEIHEERLIALIILSNRFAKAEEREKFQIYKLYLKNTKYINNWDLVDTSAEYIVGGYLYDKDRKVLQKLAKSKSLWERRIAMLSTFHFIKKGECKETLRIAKILLKDEHDLIHKASGWMLREMGKRVSEKELRGFLEKYASKMPRTMLRYSIEKFSSKDRRYYLDLK